MVCRRTLASSAPSFFLWYNFDNSFLLSKCIIVPFLNWAHVYIWYGIMKLIKVPVYKQYIFNWTRRYLGIFCRKRILYIHTGLYYKNLHRLLKTFLKDTNSCKYATCSEPRNSVAGIWKSGPSIISCVLTFFGLSRCVCAWGRLRAVFGIWLGPSSFLGSCRCLGRRRCRRRRLRRRRSRFLLSTLGLFGFLCARLSGILRLHVKADGLRGRASRTENREKRKQQRKVPEAKLPHPGNVSRVLRVENTA